MYNKIKTITKNAISINIRLSICCSGTLLTAFDFGFLKSRGFRIAELPCIMQTATPVLNLPSKGNYRGPKYPNVEEAYKFLTGDQEFVESHRAADDAMHEADIAYELYKRGDFRF